MKKIVHLTSAHPRYDIRVFKKECISLANNSFNVSIVVADSIGNEVIDGVNIYGVSKSNGRLKRIFFAPFRVYLKALALSADLYQVHDPELLPLALLLRIMGKKVIFDSHEDVPNQILSKTYLVPVLLKILSKTFKLFEVFASKRMTHIIAATPFIRDKFLGYGANSIDINNYPIANELTPQCKKDGEVRDIIYVGAIAETRGASNMVRAIENLPDISLNLAGTISPPRLADELKSLKGWKNVNFFGQVDRVKVKDLMSRSAIGVVVLEPTPSYIVSLPIKMFEYMSAGLPVIASDFPMWKDIVEENKCGICIKPNDPKALAEAVIYLNTNPEEAIEMGRNGRKAIEEKYNWAQEERKYIELINKLLN